MPPSSRIPTLLQPYTRLSRNDSTTLVTSTLGASANWLLIRFICDALNSSRNSNNPDGGAEKQQDANIVLVSWMRDWEYWKAEARKCGGLDLERLKRDRRFAFVDGLSGLFLLPEEKNSTGTTDADKRGPGSQLGGGLVPGRSRVGVLPMRGPPPPPPPAAAAATRGGPVGGSTTATATAMTGTSNASPTPGHYVLSSTTLDHLHGTIEAAVQHLSSAVTAAAAADSQKPNLIILDTPSFLLATSPEITPSQLSSMVLRLHTLTPSSHVLASIPADDALLSLSTPPQPLEIDGHNFLVKMAHMSNRILSCRVLDTGVARDVSGVLRITGGNGRVLGRGLLDFGVKKDGEGEAEVGGREFLYKIAGDGGVKVFERGAGEEG